MDQKLIISVFNELDKFEDKIENDLKDHIIPLRQFTSVVQIVNDLKHDINKSQSGGKDITNINKESINKIKLIKKRKIANTYSIKRNTLNRNRNRNRNRNTKKNNTMNKSHKTKNKFGKTMNKIRKTKNTFRKTMND